MATRAGLGKPDAARVRATAHARLPSLEVWPLRGLLYCACGAPFYAARWVDATRVYRSLCGCRLVPLDARAVELRAHVEADALTAGLHLDAGDPGADTSVFARIEVGGTVADIVFVRRV